MKIPKVANAIGNIDDELIVAAAQSKKRSIKFKPLAACVAAVLTISVIAAALFIDAANTSPIDKRYKNLELYSLHAARLWEWEYLAESEKNYEAEINGIKYEKKSGRTVSEEFIGEKIGRFDVLGYDGIMILEDKRVVVPGDVYKLKNVSENEFIAIKIKDNFYVFKNAVYDPPNTLGELFERVDLSKFLELSRFYENKNEQKHFLLNDDEYVWSILSNCKAAKFVSGDLFDLYQREYVSFSVSSEALGVYKNGFTITKDGYLYTNVFGWSYLFDIGEDAAGKIIKYAKENSTKTSYEPYDTAKKVYGEIVEITDDYILLDDTILCKNKKEGITYKILIDDIRISRYFDSGFTKIGKTVSISYYGEIDEENQHTVTGAFDLSGFTIVDKNKKKIKNNSSTVSSVSHMLSDNS